ncbi:DoxX family protein [Lonsdalea quercina]|uniref:DoxX family protein n=1 Tax=Lonsdalea quercina TaxID=71657 RepID=UPI0039755959
MLKLKNLKFIIYFSRIALAATFLSVVADRFGFWGNTGELGVSWGNMNKFFLHVSLLAPWAPAAFIPVLGWVVNILEFVLGIALLLGIKPKMTALATAGLFLIFAISMAAFQSVKLMLNFSVLPCSACAALLYFLGEIKSKTDVP